jgi:hypothetical protein
MKDNMILYVLIAISCIILFLVFWGGKILETVTPSLDNEQFPYQTFYPFSEDF